MEQAILFVLLITAAAGGVLALVAITRGSPAPNHASANESPYAVSTEGMKRCPSCGVGNLVTEQRCSACGKKLPN
jgi:hypothetical protein